MSFSNTAHLRTYRPPFDGIFITEVQALILKGKICFKKNPGRAEKKEKIIGKGKAEHTTFGINLSLKKGCRPFPLKGTVIMAKRYLK
ncbi:hypothetical protein TPE_2183 [Treponema pedis str. T A4]|uniref:Uncharacterized protein n=1 Tax=Treponema pedis str. T A4 TaxID=1291379 RepID=S5ZPV2_9SPIR|nr:hypothetical protein TPE_2183 [Treponema pedis str. T A4]